MANKREKKKEIVTDFIFLSSKITEESDQTHEIKKMLLFGRKAMTNLDSVLKNRDVILPTKVQQRYSQSYGFSSRHVRMWELDYKEGWAQKNWCFWNVVLEKTLESPLDCKETKPVNLKGNQPWIFIGRTDAEAEAPILRPLDRKIWLIGKDRDAGKKWGQDEKEMTEDEMVRWHHWLHGHEFEQTLGDNVNDGQGSLTCCSLWGCKESDKTYWIRISK